MAYSIQAALESGMFDAVIVSTDDQEIARIAREYGADVPFLRSDENSNDYATIADAMMEVLDFYKSRGVAYDQLACLFATAPFITPEKIKQAVSELENTDKTSVFFIQEFSYPIWRSLKIDGNGNLSMNWPENLNKRSQDLPKAYHDAGQFYVAHVDAFLSERTFFTQKSGGVHVSDLEARDIDTPADWEVAEALYKMHFS